MAIAATLAPEALLRRSRAGNGQGDVGQDGLHRVNSCACGGYAEEAAPRTERISMPRTAKVFYTKISATFSMLARCPFRQDGVRSSMVLKGQMLGGGISSYISAV